MNTQEGRQTWNPKLENLCFPTQDKSVGDLLGLGLFIYCLSDTNLQVD